MALALSFSVVERNDNTLLTITDTSGVYHVVTNPTGWGAPNPLVTDISDPAGPQALNLNITRIDSEGTHHVYDAIDLHALLSVHLTVTDLVFPLNCSLIKDAGTAIGTATEELPDGIYEFTYTLAGVGGDVSTLSQLVYGKVRNATYELLRQMNTSYEYEGYIDDGAVLAVFAKTYLDAILANDVSARETSVLDELYTLERLLINESTYDV